METRNVVFIALFAAIVAALAVFPPITLPLVGVPITAQSLGVMLAGGVLGAVRGGLAVVLFLVLVAIGLPLLAGGRGGFGVFLGPSGGFLVGWIVAAYAIGYMTERLWHRLNYLVAAGICFAGGVVLLYAIGVPWSAFVAEIPIGTALAGSLPFIPGDIIKCLIAAGVMVIVKRSYPIITPKSPAMPQTGM
ncbi:MAG: biotin transporter BioY [Roseitalea sp.]|jgi:biotin transport system substrate-specific component|uniref:Biotin transporter n=1 Tax=Oceaniradius stylonematis TaxID=2184161 RepID=A0A3A8ACD9_9HYPH|nr:biotin transporter BioY [Oceaniradius stylonematis]MBO6553581.1 biotin transporter BioY [Roseitalea sp.]MBO6952624.1 biotin transporter BioY [Rhizobiaceae bacterium]RNC96343.1 MAG: biotin transporter BioY [Oricola sp.]MBO6592889.1 biotin transporter BioY [Roseitalea sp.]MBO6600368.1 biotin transporter BioY [Roseitalea sp.]